MVYFSSDSTLTSGNVEDGKDPFVIWSGWNSHLLPDRLVGCTSRRVRARLASCSPAGSPHMLTETVNK